MLIKRIHIPVVSVWMCIVLLCSCTRISLNELQQYVQDPENGLSVTQENTNGIYSLMYKPPQLIYYLKYGTGSAYPYQRFLEENRNVYFFEMDMRLNRNTGAVTTPFLAESARLNFSVNSGLNGGYPLSYHAERTNEKKCTINMSFECEPGKDIKVNYRDIFGGSDVLFVIKASALENLPKSELQ